MYARSLALGCLAWWLAAGPVQAQDHEPVGKIAIAVTEFVSKGGVDQSKMDALSDMMANQIREMGPFKVIGKADILAALKLEEQKQLLGCADDSCLAEIGGALGAKYIVVGNISLFTNTWLLNLKLLDVEKIEVIKGVSRSITGAEDVFINALPQAAYELIQVIPDVEVVNPGAVQEVKGDRPRTEGGWFVPPGGRKGDFQLSLGLGLFLTLPTYVTDRGDGVGMLNFTALDDDPYVAFWPALQFGYNFTDWLTVAARLSGTLGKAGSRQRNALEAALSFQGSMMGDSWFQPVAYFDIGFAFVRDEHPNDSGLPESGRYELYGLLASLGVGMHLFFTPNWFVGAQLGGTIRAHFALFNRDADGSLRRISGARAIELGITVALTTGYEF
jgi:TolB-like protein